MDSITAEMTATSKQRAGIKVKLPHFTVIEGSKITMMYNFCQVYHLKILPGG